MLKTDILCLGICVFLCILGIAVTQIMGALLNDPEIRGMGLIGLALLVVVAISCMRGCEK